MNFTFKEWNKIRQALEVAVREYEKTRELCKPSDEENSLYQIYTRQINETSEFVSRIENAIL